MEGFWSFTASFFFNKEHETTIGSYNSSRIHLWWFLTLIASLRPINAQGVAVGAAIKKHKIWNSNCRKTLLSDVRIIIFDSLFLCFRANLFIELTMIVREHQVIRSATSNLGLILAFSDDNISECYQRFQKFNVRLDSENIFLAREREWFLNLKFSGSEFSCTQTSIELHCIGLQRWIRIIENSSDKMCWRNCRGQSQKCFAIRMIQWNCAELVLLIGVVTCGMEGNFLDNFGKNNKPFVVSRFDDDLIGSRQSDFDDDRYTFATMRC